MFGWLIRLLLVVAGFIASFFVARDALNFDVIQMVIAVVLFTIICAIMAFWSEIKKWFKPR